MCFILVCSHKGFQYILTHLKKNTGNIFEFLFVSIWFGLELLRPISQLAIFQAGLEITLQLRPASHSWSACLASYDYRNVAPRSAFIVGHFHETRTLLQFFFRVFLSVCVCVMLAHMHTYTQCFNLEIWTEEGKRVPCLGRAGLKAPNVWCHLCPLYRSIDYW